MKFLRNRYEIAEEINIKGTPVLTVDIAHPMRDYSDCYEGSKVRVLGGRSRGYETLDTCCTVEMFGDEPGNECHDEPWRYRKIILMGGSVVIKAAFSRSDLDNMVEWSNARVVKPGDKVILFFRGEAESALRVMRIPERVNPHCSTVCVLEDID